MSDPATPKKSDRIAAFVESLQLEGSLTRDPRYVGFFQCFNRGDYYEAHDVLEDLWLSTQGPDREFYKGLIQVAGAFVHLRKQREHPHHPHHGRRLVPAARIFRLAIARLTPFAPSHLGVNVEELLTLCQSHLECVEEGVFANNPWNCEDLPIIPLT